MYLQCVRICPLQRRSRKEKGKTKKKKEDGQAATPEGEREAKEKASKPLPHEGGKEEGKAKKQKGGSQAASPEREREAKEKSKKQPKHKKGRAFLTRKSEVGGAGGMPVHYMVLPAVLLGGVAILVYIGEQWLLGPAVNRPLPLTPAVSSEWRNDSEYGSRLWGTYR